MNSSSTSSLDLSLLEKVRHRGGKIIARCPACAESGGDRSGQHLVILPGGKFACAAAQGDGPHRQRIFALAGIPMERQENATGNGRRQDHLARRRLQIQQREQAQVERRRQTLGKAATDLRRALVAAHAWDFADAWDDSPQRLAGGPEETCPLHFLGALFPADALVWAGETHHSGQDGRYAHCWRTLSQRRAEPHADQALTGPMTTPAIWQPGTTSRTAAQVLHAPYTVLDFDGFDGRHPQTPEEIARHLLDSLAIIRWLREGQHWRLAAILRTGNKSLHAWFHTPAPAALATLREAAPQLGLDPGLIGRPEHPCRLPGHPHPKTGELSRVVWLRW